TRKASKSPENRAYKASTAAGANRLSSASFNRCLRDLQPPVVKERCTGCGNYSLQLDDSGPISQPGIVGPRKYPVRWTVIYRGDRRNFVRTMKILRSTRDLQRRLTMIVSANRPLAVVTGASTGI